MNANRGRDAYEVLHVRADAHQVVIRAAYRALAGLLHPDTNRKPGAERQMAELNAAYDLVRSADRRAVYDRTRIAPAPQVSPIVPPSAATAPPPRAPAGRTTVDFGRYAGWALEDLAKTDPDYLKWLARHSSGIRYRARIEALLNARTTATASERMRRGR